MENQSQETPLSKAYDGSTLAFKVLRAVGWGPLINLGYFSLLKPFHFCNVPEAQTELVRRTLRLGHIQPGERVLDIACGRGKSTYMMSCAAGPNATVVGLDLLPQNISTASWLYGSNGSKLSYVEGDAHGLDRDPAAVALAPNVIFCIEAAFHFDRPAFLASAARVLAPGGRLVVVDFAWNNEAVASAVRAGSLEGEAMATMRAVWQFTDFSTESEYRQMAAQAGLAMKQAQDWTHNVLAANRLLLGATRALSHSTVGQTALRVMFPELQLTPEEWMEFDRVAAHQLVVMKHMRYMAYVFEHMHDE